MPQLPPHHDPASTFMCPLSPFVTDSPGVKMYSDECGLPRLGLDSFTDLELYERVL